MQDQELPPEGPLLEAIDHRRVQVRWQGRAGRVPLAQEGAIPGGVPGQEQEPLPVGEDAVDQAGLVPLQEGIGPADELGPSLGHRGQVEPKLPPLVPEEAGFRLP